MYSHLNRMSRRSSANDHHNTLKCTDLIEAMGLVYMLIRRNRKKSAYITTLTISTCLFLWYICFYLSWDDYGPNSGVDYGNILLKNKIAQQRIQTMIEEVMKTHHLDLLQFDVVEKNEFLGIKNSSTNSTSSFLPLCPTVPASLRGSCPRQYPCYLENGAVFVDSNHSDNMTRDDVREQNPDLSLGGSWSPPHCISRHRVAVIIPYRDREKHLIILLSHLLPILQRQELQFKIFVVEQEGKDTFNKARIMNAAFREAIQQYDFQCVVFHDVDLLPEDDRNMYSCPQQPRHMSVAIDEMGYKVPYEYLVGGVLSMRTDHYQLVNGYSNLYWGWGAEDDDMAFRIMHVGLKITRPPSKVARYKMIRHEKRKPTDWRKRRQLLRSGTRRFNFDGLNSVSYTLISIKEFPLYTHIMVNIGKPPSVS